MRGLKKRAQGWAAGAMVLVGPAVATGAELPAHDPLRIVIISDEVNPHGLPEDQLTQPGELAAAIESPGAGIEVEFIDEVSSQCIDDPLTMLGTPGSVDVVVYFAHLSATGCDGSDRQAELTAAFEAHLQAGGGVVVFHHGIYEAGGKEPILQLLGGRASSIAWDPGAGQDVIAVAPGHFVVDQGMRYPSTRNFGGVGVADGEYGFFNNTPDERYDALDLLTEGGEERTILFASDTGGTPRVLGYDLRRAGWMGHVVFYQPGEYQPNALDDVNGSNFQILANAIHYVGTTQEDPGTTSDGETTGGMPGDESGGADATGGGNEAGGTETGSEADGTAGATTGEPGADGDGGGGGGCGCRTAPGGAAGPLALLGVLFGLRSRRPCRYEVHQSRSKSSTSTRDRWRSFRFG
ncbi:hypothetical protein [Paraliomyxa miuraensis]|uniref:hypothetical protein n=1 Tax=Paraliomyxa miuraensis TaxID=376150 RepID=UPI002250BF2D|nr:hypothetical protein [Paraliomyxa miuraensis]MCX4240789.1 hypothetical protein [Paraliomyxa miuraensis]